ncbi:MAG: outer rane porin f precursor [Pseudomonadota bacterium]
MKVSKSLRLSTVAFALTGAMTAAAEGVFVSGMASHYQLQNDRDFNSQIGLSVGVGYKLDSPWAFEVTSFSGRASEVALGSSEAMVNALKLEALYYIWEDRFSPYAAFGVGRTDFDANDNAFDRKTNTFNLGGGFHYRLFDNVSFRGDLRFLRDHGQADNDVQLGFGLTYHVDQPKPAAAPVSLRRELDSDGDGVMDSRDRCPNSPRGTKVNEVGCTEAPVVVEKTAPAPAVMNVRLEVNFATDSSAVDSKYFSEIEQVAEYMAVNGNATVVIEGHTDSRGSEKYNQWLSARRAKAVADVLEKRFGIEGSRIASKGYGESQPLVANDSAGNMATNRRVIAVISQ